MNCEGQRGAAASRDNERWIYRVRIVMGADYKARGRFIDWAASYVSAGVDIDLEDLGAPMINRWEERWDVFRGDLVIECVRLSGMGD